MDVEEAMRIVATGEGSTLTFVQASEALAAEVRRLTAEPNLAAASTRELLEELRTRGNAFATDDRRDGHARIFSRLIEDVLRFAPEWLLDYRAVGS